MLVKSLPRHLAELAKLHPAIYRQFCYSTAEGRVGDVTRVDPLSEEKYTVARGLIHKYRTTALVLLTLNCAAYCRFCTRRRLVSDVQRGIITERDLDKMIIYIRKHPKINEVIISGGDPLTAPDLLKTALTKLSRLPQIKIFRVGSRLPVSDPSQINDRVLSALRAVKNRPLYLMLHFEHPAEITSATVAAVKKLQSVSTMLLSQSVFLKGVNDNAAILEKLFNRLVEIGVKPYYLLRCDYTSGAGHFIVDIKKEIEIMTKLRARLSGLACPMYVVDVLGGMGKIPVPLNFWNFDAGSYWDFKGERFAN